MLNIEREGIYGLNKQEGAGGYELMIHWPRKRS